jgi:hypothetical protein
MARPAKKIGGQDMSALLADAAQETTASMDRGNRQGPKALIGMPWNKGEAGVLVDATEAIEFTYDFKSNADIFSADIKKILKEPEPGYTLAWPKADDAGTAGHVRSGMMVKVKPEELREDIEFAITTHKSPSGEEVRYFNHVLCKISPKAHAYLYDRASHLSNARIANAGQQFKEKIYEESRGTSEGSVSATVE